jgi:MYXO-CTERM domain-containing protein
MAAGKAITAALAVAAVAGAVLWRRRSRQREHVDLFFSDGSMVSFEQGSIEAARLLPLAHEILAAAPDHP